jgi:hypothetical protein
MTFKVDRMPAVDQQIRDLAERAKARRIGHAYVDALKRMIDQLTNNPLDWGDPEYRTQTPGGVVCHGIAWPLCVHFVVFEFRQLVIITDITPLPESPLTEL